MTDSEDPRPFGAQLYDALLAEFKGIPLGMNYAEIQAFKEEDRDAVVARFKNTSYAFVQLMKTGTIPEIVAALRVRTEEAAQATAAAMSMSMFAMLMTM